MTEPTKYNLKPCSVVNAGHASETAWYPIAAVLDVIRDSRAGEWSWACNSRCKYIDLRIDMRSGACVIHDRFGAIISMEELARQL